MSRQAQIDDKPSSPKAGKLLQSGIIFSAAGFLALGVHFCFQLIISRELGGRAGEFGLFQFGVGFIVFLSLPLTIASQAITHYVARFHFSGDDARLHGLLAGCRKFLFYITIGGSFAAIILVKPLGVYFKTPRASLMLVALFVAVAALWGAYLTVLCQGLGWFKRLALIALLAAVLRILFGSVTAHVWPVAEWAVAASGVMVAANLILFVWRKEFPRRTENIVSPWTPEFRSFLIASAAWAIGTNCFCQWDVFVAQKYFGSSKQIFDAYGSAAVFARQLPNVMAPLLTVLFTHRSSRQHHHDDALREQLKLLGLYAAGLICGAVGLFILRGFCLQLLHRNTPEAAGMIGPFACTMVFAGLLQALGTWALASRWLKISLLYGGLGISYWLVLLFLGKSPAALLQMMPVATGLAFSALFLVWFTAMRSRKIGELAQS
jgi:hypothetical protein